MYTKEVPSSDAAQNKEDNVAASKAPSHLQWTLWSALAMAALAYSVTAFMMDFRRAQPLLCIELSGLPRPRQAQHRRFPRRLVLIEVARCVAVEDYS